MWQRWLSLQLIAFALSLMVMSALRWVFFVVNEDMFSASPGELLVTAFVHGVRFDAAVLGLLAGLAFFVSLIVGLWRPKLAKAVWLVLYVLGLVYIVAVSFGDIFYSQYAGKRLSYEVAVFFTSQAFPLLATAAHDFPVLFPFAMVAGGAVVYGGIRLYRFLPDAYFKHSFHLKSVVATLVFIALLTVVSRGGLQGRPLRVGDGFVTENPTVNQLVFNAPFLTLTSLRFKSTHMPQLMAKDEAYRTCRDAMGTGAQFVSDTYPFVRVTAPPVNAAKRPNVYVFIFESWSKKYLADPDYAYLTPNFQQMRREGLSFENAYATGTRSPNGIYSVVTGFPDFIHDTVMRRPQLATDFRSMADVFKDRGYPTYFIHGGNLDFDNLEGFLRHQGFQYMYGKRDFPNTPSKVWWGVPDGAMYDLGLKVLAGVTQPYFALIFSTSTHGPYSIPDEFEPKVSIPRDHVEAAYLTALHYADHEFGRFIGELRRLGHLNDAVIVLTADHSHHKGLNLLEDKEIPLVFYGPAYGLSGRSTRLTSQIDVLPTLSAILGFNDMEASLGRDLRNPVSPEYDFAYWVSGGTINLRRGTWLVTQSEGHRGSLRIYDIAKGFEAEGHPSEDERNSLVHMLHAMYECSTRPVLEDKVFSEKIPR
ncbi:MAG: LTA synthase family protein [Thiohalomonadaceae bacterium]